MVKMGWVVLNEGRTVQNSKSQVTQNNICVKAWSWWSYTPNAFTAPNIDGNFQLKGVRSRQTCKVSSCKTTPQYFAPLIFIALFKIHQVCLIKNMEILNKYARLMVTLK